MGEFALFFIYGLIEDTFAALYNKNVQREKPWQAFFASVAIFLFSVFCLEQVLTDYSILAPKTWGMATGSGFGTVAVIHYYKYKRKHDQTKV